MKDELLSAFLEGFFGTFRLAASLVVAGPVAIANVCRSFVNRAPPRPAGGDRSRPKSC